MEEYKRQAEWSIFYRPLLHLKRCEVCVHCATVEELTSNVGQPVAWSEPVVVMLIDVRRAHFYSAARRKVFVELPAEACTDKSKVGLFALDHVWLQRRWSELEIHDLPSHDRNWFLFKVKRLCAFTDILKGNSVCECMEMILSL